MSDPLKLEFQMVVSYPAWILRNVLRFFARATSTLKAKPSHQSSVLSCVVVVVDVVVVVVFRHCHSLNLDPLIV